jgi:diguanylate cyclase (GGDEF)-like protein
LINDEWIGELLIDRQSLEEFKTPFVFYYEWGKSHSVFVVGEDRRGLFYKALQYEDFNGNFWPALDILLRQDDKRKQSYLDYKKIRDEYSRSKRDLLNSGKEIKRRITEMNSFVDISEKFYSILDENQLFSNLKETICNRIGSSNVAILHPGKDGEYLLEPAYESTGENYSSPILGSDSELYGMLSKNTKPLILPLAASGLNNKNEFLEFALSRGFQIIAPMGAGKKPGCFLLIGEKKDKGQYEESDLNFLSVIANIASLSLANIRHFKTIEKLSYTDSMTGIYNYRYFYKRLGEEILRAKRYNRDISLVILDIDNFKQFNDKYGHQTGDMVLKRTAELITGTIRSIDIVSRYGGEEFCIIMPDTGEGSGSAFIERLKNKIAEFRFKNSAINEETSITVSVGCSVYPQHASARDRLIYCADMALLKAKSLGRNKAIMYQADFVENQIFPTGG